jgi:hypothetical protein
MSVCGLLWARYRVGVAQVWRHFVTAMKLRLGQVLPFLEPSRVNLLPGWHDLRILQQFEPGQLEINSTDFLLVMRHRTVTILSIHKTRMAIISFLFVALDDRPKTHEEDCQ